MMLDKTNTPDFNKEYRVITYNTEGPQRVPEYAESHQEVVGVFFNFCWVLGYPRIEMAGQFRDL